jgi:hypothetical protein
MYFGAVELDFLGHIVGSSSISPPTCSSSHRPQTSSPFNGFWMWWAYISGSCQAPAGVLRPLPDALRDHPRRLERPVAMSAAFSAIKQAIATAIPMAQHRLFRLFSPWPTPRIDMFGAVLKQLHSSCYSLIVTTIFKRKKVVIRYHKK